MCNCRGGAATANQTWVYQAPNGKKTEYTM